MCVHRTIRSWLPVRDCSGGADYPPASATVAERLEHARQMSDSVVIIDWDLAGVPDPMSASPTHLAQGAVPPEVPFQLQARFRLSNPSLPAPRHVGLHVFRQRPDGNRVVAYSGGAPTQQVAENQYAFSAQLISPRQAGKYEIEVSYLGHVLGRTFVTVEE